MNDRSNKRRLIRIDSKNRIVQYMGGCCANCGYNKCYEALEFHHLDPSSKEFNISRTAITSTNWGTICAELDKCIMLCSNCHREVHAGKTSIPSTPAENNKGSSLLVPALRKNPALKNPCIVCGTDKTIRYKFCSRKCYGLYMSRLDWETYDLLSKIETKSIKEISEELGISYNTIRKRISVLKYRKTEL